MNQLDQTDKLDDTRDMESAQVKHLDREVLTTVLHETVRDLSPHAVAALVAHPEAVRAALAVAADALRTSSPRRGSLVISGTDSRLVQKSEASLRIAARTQMGREEDLLTSEQFAARVGLKTRQSVHDWLRRGRIIGWQGAKRGYRFPSRQIDERGHPLNGLDRITPQFEDGFAAWRWLTAPLTALDGAEPLALLRKGEVALVEAAARGDFQGDFA
ncbi:MAG: hypothetical protein OXN89_01235 [Bryobacterales bacterium]|nr:hypothetical protein [Bryobacterales bacterium]